MEVPTASCRYIQQYRSIAVDGAFYRIVVNGQTVQLSLSKPEPTRWDIAEYEIRLPNLTHISSLYARQCRVFLLLGRSDQDDMHLLIVPSNGYAPELKTIPLSWADARAMLNETWEYEWSCSKRSNLNKVSDRNSDLESEWEPDQGSVWESDQGSVQGSEQGSDQGPDQETDDVHT